ncbi:MAG: PDDEXK nuclease domain-containing protein [Desulfobacteraceae bacterium]|nr:PDDEXK nuclease domain-containing protein [Desulfobacteraceae bacterium]
MDTNRHELKRNDSALFKRVVTILEQARSNVVRSVNSNTVVAYWLIGREIVQELQKGEERAEYGKRVIENLSNRLTERYGKGFSVPNLRNFRKFYVMFQDRKPEIRYPLGSELTSERERYPTGSELNVPGKGGTKDGLSLTSFHPNLSWSHYRALMRVDKKEAREFYETETAECGWNKRQLERQIHSLFYDRLLMSKDKKGMLLEDRAGEDGVFKQVDVLKDPYVLEFLDLPDTAKMHESDLEQAIIDNLQHFLLELGKGFSFVARQKRMQFGDEDFYVDLVFYNFILKCFVLIDLKIGKLTHQDIGQMDGYVRMYEEHGKVEGDNPTIGLILCSEKNEAIARYSVLNNSKQLFASKFMLYLPTEEELERELERERRLIEERQQAGDERDQDSD